MTWVMLVVMGLVYVVLAVSSLLGKSVTVDEFGHLPAGYNLLTTGDFRYCQLNPPLMNVLSALPAAVMGPQRSDAPRPPRFRNFAPGHEFWSNGYEFMFRYRDDYRRLFSAARCVTVALVGGLGVLLFLWARCIAGTRGDFAGLLAAGLLWFSPNVLAHARLVTTDAGAACFVALAVWMMHLLLRRPDGPRAVGCGVALGLAQLVKFTAMYLYPVFIVAVIVWKLCHKQARLGELAKWTVVALLVSVVVINAGYLFDGTGASLGSYEFTSNAAKSVQGALPGSAPVPLPREFVAAFDRQLFDVSFGDSSYLLGESYEGGRWYYFLVLLAVKEPIPLVLLIGLAAWVGWRGGGVRAAETVLLLLPGALLLLMFSWFSNKQIGLRMLLPAAPLVCVWVATTLGRAGWRRWTRWAVGGLLLWFAGETAWVHPHYLAYFNELAGGPSGGKRVALDSNLDWGQDLPGLKAYMDRERIERVQLFYFGRVDPAIYGIDYFVDRSALRPGFVAVSATMYGRWYRLYDHGQIVECERIDATTLGEPVATIGHSIDVYRVGSPPP